MMKTMKAMALAAAMAMVSGGAMTGCTQPEPTATVSPAEAQALLAQLIRDLRTVERADVKAFLATYPRIDVIRVELRRQTESIDRQAIDGVGVRAAAITAAQCDNLYYLFLRDLLDGNDDRAEFFLNSWAEKC